ncbi:MAG: oligosaccharide flippase family protein [Prevotellaceae bacterium]|nr:oligosaccharide flippase family protein [Prevotellaceae bacterium]
MALGILQIAGYVFPLITMPYLAHTLGVLYIGKIAFAGAVIAYFQTLVDYGFNYTATRDIARYREDKEKISILFSSVMYCKFCLVLMSAVILGCMTAIISIFHDNANIFWATFILLPGYAMFPEWLFQGLEKMKYITILNLLSKLFFTIAVFIFIKDKSDYIWQPILIGLGYIAAGFLSWYIILKKMNIHFLAIRRCHLLQTMKGSTDIFINQLMPNLYNNFSVMLLGLCGTPNANGLYEAGNKLVSIADRMLNVISRAFFPFLSRRLDKHSLYAKYQLVLTICCSCALFIMAEPLIIFLFSKEFVSAIWVLRLLAVSLFFLSMTHIYGVNFLILQGKERQLRNITFLVSFLGMLMAYPVISFFDYLGAAIVVGGTRAILGCSIYLYSKKCK